MVLRLAEMDLEDFVSLYASNTSRAAQTLKMPLQQPVLPLALEDKREALLTVGGHHLDRAFQDWGTDLDPRALTVWKL